MDLSIEYGPVVDNTGVSHLDTWQYMVHTQPNASSLVSRHQHPRDFRWVGSQHLEEEFVHWTYADLDRGARRLAASLSTSTHVERRPIAALIYNQAEWALFYWACAYLRSPFVPINPKCATRAEEISHMLDLVRPAVLVAADLQIAHQLERSLSLKTMSSIRLRLVLNEDGASQSTWSVLSKIVSGEPTPPETPDVIAADDTMIILFTSGTTALPKPCALTSFQCLNAALGYMDSQKIDSRHRFVQHLPGFHSYGIGWSLGVWARGGLVIYPSNSFEARASLDCFDIFNATHMGLVPTTAQAMLAHSAFKQTDLSSLISIDVSGAGVLPSLIETCTANFKVPACTSYGMTESPGTLTWPVDAGSVIRNGEVMSGKPVRATVVKICEPGTRDIVLRGTVGELHNGGPQVIPGYMDPQASIANFYEDENGTRWVITGDQAVMDDDGAVRICGRYKDLIIRGGENISPSSIEDHLSKQKGIAAAYVIGIPDELAGEVPAAVVTTTSNDTVDLHKLRLAVSRDLGPAFGPNWIFHLTKDLRLDSYPTTASGKIRKVELAQIVRDHLRKTRQVHRSDHSLPTANVLIDLWASISGLSELQSSSLIDSFADSLMMMQLSSAIKREIGPDVTVEDLKVCRTIQEQANLIDSRPLQSLVVATRTRDGPPALQDLPHARGNPALFNRSKDSATTLLLPLGLTWDDVEDCVPLPDWDAIFCHRSRPTSWNLRFTYHANTTASQLEAAVKESIKYHPTLRSFAFQDSIDETLLLTVRPTQKWFETCTTSGWRVPDTRDLPNVLLDHPELDRGSAPGPLVRFHFVEVESDKSSGLILVGSHAVLDMTMTNLWLEDVANLLSGDRPPIPHAPFHSYATAFFHHRNGPSAQAEVQYWAEKLHGISSLPESAFWPPQRSPEWFKGNDAGWTRWTGVPARPSERPLPLATKALAQKGLRRVVPVPDLFRLKSAHGVPVFMLVKSALALLNVALTGAPEALFGTINAARTWPFSADYSSREREGYVGAHNPLDISGCTTEYVLDRVRVPRHRSLVAFMQEVVREEERNSRCAHAPFGLIVDRLRDPISADDKRSFTERERDAEAVLPLIRRQSFNWLPAAPMAGDAKGGGLRLLEMLTRMDNGLTVTGFLAEDKRSVVLGFTWDAEHMSLGEAERALEMLAGLVERMGKEENWVKTVDEVMRFE